MNKGWVIGGVIIILIALGYFLFSSNEPNNSQTSASGNGLANSNDKSANGNRIDISNFAFTPAVLTISIGDTVYWTNKDSAPHTVTSDSGSELSSPKLNKNDEYSHTFTQSGTYEYHCTFHTSMKAKIIVK